MKQGDLVVRQSYGGDLLFRIVSIQYDQALLKGFDYRLLADAPLSDLQSIHEQTSRLSVYPSMRRQFQQSVRRMQSLFDQSVAYKTNQYDLKNRELDNSLFFEWPGKVLHLDGDANYLKKSMQLYESTRVPAEGFFVNESKMAEALIRLLPDIAPDIVVITGHDGVLKNRAGAELASLSSYKNSQHFVNAVRVAREYQRNLDQLVVVAGACQSHYEALLHSGANFASSPGRVLIHALDPVYVAIKASYTSLKEIIDLPELVAGTISGIDGVGGVETYGRYRVGYPMPKSYV